MTFLQNSAFSHELYSPDDILGASGSDGILAHGGFATIRLGYENTIGVVAIKSIRLSGSRRTIERNREKALKEIQTIMAASRTCDNIVRVFGMTNWRMNISLVNEYLPGGNLLDLMLQKQIDIKPPLMLRFCCDIANALTFVESLQDTDKCTAISDISPDNILLTEFLTCKLGDCSGSTLAALVGHMGSARSGRYTRVYAAPERIHEMLLLEVTRSMRVYSFGMMVYTILSRKLPIPDWQDEKDFLDCMRKGRRPNLDVIEDMKARQIKRKYAGVVDMMMGTMQSAWHSHPHKRPTIEGIRNLLYDCFSDQEFAQVGQNVADVVRLYGVQPAKRSEFVWKSLTDLEDSDLERSENENCIIFSKTKTQQKDYSQPDTDDQLPYDQEFDFNQNEEEARNIIIIGGNHTELSVIEFNPQKKSWRNLEDLPHGTLGACAVNFRGFIYITSGGKGRIMDATNDVFRCNIRENPIRWAPVPNMLQSRKFAASAVVDDLIFVVGGEGGQDICSSGECFEPRSGTWTEISPMNRARLGHAMVTTCGDLFCMGGYDGERALRSAERYFVSTDTWSAIPAMKESRFHFGAIAINGFIYVMGGFNGREPISSMEMYDITKDTWRNLAPMIVPRDSFKACVIGGQIYVIGGRTFNQCERTVEKYNPSNNKWEIFCSTSDEFWWHSAVET